MSVSFKPAPAREALADETSRRLVEAGADRDAIISLYFILGLNSFCSRLKSGSKLHALQTLCAGRDPGKSAKRLECARLAGALDLFVVTDLLKAL